MTNAEYDLLKKQEYMSELGIEAIDDNTSEDVRLEWFARLNQIKSGHILKLTHQQIDMYCALEGYDKREFVKSCIYEGVSEEILSKIVQCDNVEAMKKLKSEHYRSDYIIQGINNKVNSLYGALDDCEQKFGVFEKYLEQFSDQVKHKEDEISSLKAEISEYRNKIEKLQEENNGLKVLNAEVKAEYERNVMNSKPREIVVTRVIKDESSQPVENNDIKSDGSDTINSKNKDRKNLLSGVKQLLGKNNKPATNSETNNEMINAATVGAGTDKTITEIKYKKEEERVIVRDVESYILTAQLSSEQLLEISKCITMDIEDEQIIAMIENNLSPSQIKNSANIIIAKRNANQRKMDKMKNDMSKAAGMAEAPVKINKKEETTKSLADSFVDDDDDDDIEEFAEEDDMEIMED